MSIYLWPRGRVGWSLALVGLALLLICLYLSQGDPAQGWGGYLVAFLFWLGLGLGAMALAMIHVLTGGAWGDLLRPQLAAALQTMPLMALALVPLLFGANTLFPWMQGPADSQRFAHQAWYLNEPFWLGRNLIFLALWLILALGLLRHLKRPSDAIALRPAYHLPPPKSLTRLAIAGLMIYAVSVFLFSVDWIMALEPRWYSSVFGLTLMLAQLLGGLAWLICFVRTRDANDPEKSRKHRGDLGNLLMMMLLGFGYLVFMDYLTAWSGNLPAETAWYLPRTLTSWKWFAAIGIVGGLLIPFAGLLSRRLKRSSAGLRSVAVLLLMGNVSYMAWLVLPSLRSEGLWFGAVDILAFLGLGALWCSVYVSALQEAEYFHEGDKAADENPREVRA